MVLELNIKHKWIWNFKHKSDTETGSIGMLQKIITAMRNIIKIGTMLLTTCNDL